MICGARMFTSASYEIGCTMALIGKSSAKTIWKSTQAMASQYSTGIYRDGYLYGVDGRADGGTARLKCLDAATGKVMWSEANYGIANLIFADGLLYLRDSETLKCLEVGAAK